MLAKIFRFHRRGSLNYVYRTGRSVRGEAGLSLRYARSRGEDFRLAVVVSKKVSKSAVMRNRIRRRIYEAVRLEKKAAGRSWPYDLVITAFDEQAASSPAEELRAAVRQLLQKAGI